jgi:hypothetical protein
MIFLYTQDGRGQSYTEKDNTTHQRRQIMKIEIATERKLYQIIGVLHIMAMIKPEGNEEFLRKVIENMADAAEGAAVNLEDIAFIVTSEMEKMR